MRFINIISSEKTTFLDIINLKFDEDDDKI